MTFLNRLERKLGWIAIGNLPLYIVTTQAIVYVWMMLNQGQSGDLTLDPVAVIYRHEYWRLLTFLFVIPLQNPLFAFFFLYLLYVYGQALENEWGSFPFTLFYLTGALGTIAAAFLFGSRDGAFYLNISIFLAFAALHPGFELLLFFILPVKIKWLAWATWAWFAYRIVVDPPPTKAAILSSLINYFLFFTGTHLRQAHEETQRIKNRRRLKNWE